MDDTQVERDAIDICESFYTGDYARFHDIVDQYADTDSPAAALVWRMSVLIKQATFSSAGMFETAPEFFSLLRSELPAVPAR